MFSKQTERREGRVPVTDEFQGIYAPSYTCAFDEPVYRSSPVSLSSSRERSSLSSLDSEVFRSYSGVDPIRSVDSGLGSGKDAWNIPSAGSGPDTWSNSAKLKEVQGETVKSEFGKKNLMTDASFDPLPAVPTYLERYTSFTCLYAVFEILTALTASLTHQQIDFELQANRKRIRAVTFLANNLCKFMIYFYQNKAIKASRTRPSIVVEFQRRSGDVICFSNLYRRLLAWPDLSKLIEPSGPDNFPSGPDSSVEFKTDFEMDFTDPITLDDPTLFNLVDMASSEDLCTQREATRVLATASSTGSNQKKIVESVSQGPDLSSSDCLLSVLPKLLTCHDEQILRNSVVILENLSQATTESCRLQLITYLLPTAVSILELPASLLVLDIQRHVVYSLLFLCQTSSDAISRNSHTGRVIEALNKRKDCLDVRLQRSVTEALRTLLVL